MDDPLFSDAGAPFTDRTHANLALDEHLWHLATRARRIAAGDGTALERFEAALSLRTLADSAIDAALVAARVDAVTWKAIAAAAKVSDSRAHDRWRIAETTAAAYRQKLLRDKAFGVADRDDTVASRAAHIDRWIREYTGEDAPADRLERMDLDAEQSHLAELRAVLLEECRPGPVPPALLLPIEQRQAQIYATLAEQLASTGAAAEARRQADMSAAYVRELESRIAAMNPAK
ncbi:hypothetical protein [Nocardia tengchongensis]|uniref:hypothetical protein n=1 Tax=Nocardia tengchongensis TaxID=2055889 RepID=UPI00361E89BF